MPDLPFPGGFAKTWTREPLAFQTGAPIATDAEALRWLGVLAENHRAGLRFPEMRVYVGDGLLQKDDLRFLPTRDERDLDAWVARAAREAEGRPFAVVVNDAQALAPSLYDRACAFLCALYAALPPGEPLRSADLVLFLGNTEHTAFGVHRDDKEVFQLVQRGTKRIRLWPDGHESAAGRPIDAVSATTGYADMLDGSVVLEGGPGAVLYWPMSHWHIAEGGGGEISVAWSLGLVHDPLTLDALLWQEALDAASEALAVPGPQPTCLRAPQSSAAGHPHRAPQAGDVARRAADEAAALDGVSDRALGTLGEALRHPEVRARATLRRLALESAWGFAMTPSPRHEEALADDAPLTLASDLHPILYAPLPGGAQAGAALAARGVTTRVTPPLAAWASALPTRFASPGAPISLTELLAAAPDPDEARAILTTLLACGALTHPSPRP